MQEISMMCRGCGKTIPMLGTVCPYCQRDKTKDAHADSLAFIWIVGAMAVGALLGALVGGIVGCLIGFCVGLCVGFIAALVLVPRSAVTQPPEVRLQDKSTAIPAQTQSPIEQRLETLDALRAKGLISDEEFSARRLAVLDEV